MNKRMKVKKLQQATMHLQKALDLFAEIGEDHSDNRFLTSDANYYKEQVADLISCDHGQAGLEPFVRILIQKVSTGEIR